MIDSVLGSIVVRKANQSTDIGTHPGPMTCVSESCRISLWHHLSLWAPFPPLPDTYPHTCLLLRPLPPRTTRAPSTTGASPLVYYWTLYPAHGNNSWETRQTPSMYLARHRAPPYLLCVQQIDHFWPAALRSSLFLISLLGIFHLLLKYSMCHFIIFIRYFSKFDSDKKIVDETQLPVVTHLVHFNI